MGNQVTCPGLLPSTELKWKTGKKVNPVPCPLLADSSNLDKLCRNVDLKDFILRNIDSDYLVSSLLLNVNKDELLTVGLSIFQNNDKESIKALKHRVTTLENLSMLGAKVFIFSMILLIALTLNE